MGGWARAGARAIQRAQEAGHAVRDSGWMGVRDSWDVLWINIQFEYLFACKAAFQ